MRCFMDRFWRKVVKTSRCWEWSAALLSGYGLFRWNGKATMAHRVSWELAYGPVPEGMVVLQKCKNRRCVRPAHLYLAPTRSSARNPPSDVSSRFWLKVNKRGPTMPHMRTCCWVWVGSLNNKGYGQLHLGGGGKHAYAHRVAWQLAHPGVPLGRVGVLHRCDNPPCVRRSHLFRGSQADNVRDMVQKGRARNGSSGRRQRG